MSTGTARQIVIFSDTKSGHSRLVKRKLVAGVVTAGLLLAFGVGVAPPSFAAPPAGDASLAGLLGARPGATRLPVPINDQVSASH